MNIPDQLFSLDPNQDSVKTTDRDSSDQPRRFLMRPVCSNLVSPASRTILYLPGDTSWLRLLP